MAHDLLKIEHPDGITVYLDQRLLIQIRDGTVTAFQTYSAASTRLAQQIIETQGLEDRYSISENLITIFENGLPIRTYTPKELLCKKEGSP
jgi:hypothetical protein